MRPVATYDDAWEVTATGKFILLNERLLAAAWGVCRGLLLLIDEPTAQTLCRGYPASQIAELRSAPAGPPSPARVRFGLKVALRPPL